MYDISFIFGIFFLASAWFGTVTISVVDSDSMGSLDPEPVPDSDLDPGDQK
jgi:hypothetical protein